MTTMKLKIQLALDKKSDGFVSDLICVVATHLVANALVGARIRKGTISAGYNQVMPSQPIAKNVLKTNKNTA